MVFLATYIVVCITALLAAAGANGGMSEVLGRLLSVFLSLPWCLVSDYFQVREGTAAGLYFDAAGMVINSLLLWGFALFMTRRESHGGH